MSRRLNPSSLLSGSCCTRCSFPSCVSLPDRHPRLMSSSLLTLAAHYVRDRATNTSKAICALQGNARWAVTGTPLQNRVGDLATICQFLRVFPYDDPKRFDSDMIQIWKTAPNEVAVGRLKRLLRCILLRRAKGTIDLPHRTDNVVTLKFNDDEREHYSEIEKSIARDIDDALEQQTNTSQGALLSVLQRINELRLICNLGVHRRRVSKRPLESTFDRWDSFSAQKAFEALASVENLACVQCGLNLSTVDVDDMLGTHLANNNYTPQLYQCLRMACASCFWQNSDLLCCGHNPSCPRAPVSHSARSRSNTASPSCEAVETVLPTKVKALVTDLKKLPSQTKWSVTLLPGPFNSSRAISISTTSVRNLF
jgi:SWI/SNF-related matrix-associated actin-dependent regulator of chromatin subfamily A3